jgi:hypothetical protein
VPTPKAQEEEEDDSLLRSLGNGEYIFSIQTSR